MRYMKLPFFWEGEEDIEKSEVYVNPFSIESYNGTTLEYEDEDGNITTSSVSVIHMKNGMMYQILMSVEDLTQAIHMFMKQ